jgi:hypothetical protein
MINEYEKKMLNSLLDKYEKSKSFAGTNKVNQRFKVRVEVLFPVYQDDSNYEVFQEINESIEILNRKGLIRGRFDSRKICSEIILQTDQFEEIYRYVGRIPKQEIRNRLEYLLKQYQNENEILKAYCSEQLVRLSENRSVQYFRDDFEEYEKVLIVVKALTKVDSEQFIREFSIQVFHDSKTFSKIKNTVENLLFEFGGFPEKEQILGNFNLVKTPTYVNFKGAGRIVLKGQEIDLSTLSGDIAISSSMLEDIQKTDVLGKAVITIENLTSFHRFNEPDFFVLYLGGFHNSVRREFIKRLYKQNPNVSYFHFGDIDAGGFYILEHLRKNTGVCFQPYKMGLATLKGYQKYAKKLTGNDKKRLRNLMNKEYGPVIAYMIENNCKLEQEAVYGDEGGFNETDMQ